MTPLLGQVFNALDTQQKGRVGQQAVLQAGWTDCSRPFSRGPRLHSLAEWTWAQVPSAPGSARAGAGAELAPRCARAASAPRRCLRSAWFWRWKETEVSVQRAVARYEHMQRLYWTSPHGCGTPGLSVLPPSWCGGPRGLPWKTKKRCKSNEKQEPWWPQAQERMGRGRQRVRRTAAHPAQLQARCLTLTRSGRSRSMRAPARRKATQWARALSPSSGRKRIRQPRYCPLAMSLRKMAMAAQSLAAFRSLRRKGKPAGFLQALRCRPCLPASCAAGRVGVEGIADKQRQGVC